MKPNFQRAKNAKTSLAIVLVGMVVVSVSSLFLLSMIENFTMNAGNFGQRNQLLTVSMIVGIIGLLFFAAYVTCIVLFIMWFRRAYFNLHTLVPSHRLKYTEGWAAGAWFVPIMHLFAPFQIATDLFYESERLLVEHGLMEKKPQYHQVKGWWWALWISSMVINQISNYTEDSLDFDVSMIITIIVMILTIGSGILAINMINNYSKMEVLLNKLPDEARKDGNLRITNDDLLDSGI